MLSHTSQSTSEIPVARALAPLPYWKRFLDLTVCIVALPVLIVAWLVMAVWMALVAPGPVLFRQERIGYRGRMFILYKFRTMTVGADAASHRSHVSSLLKGNQPMRKLDAVGDSRLIPGGWLLRASGADELPQLLNVLRGDMSLVGPRPCVPYEYEQYSAQQRARFSTLPGLTGLWQVSGKNRTTFADMIRLDIEYSRTKSLLLDLKIMARTLPALGAQILETQLLRRTASKPPSLPSPNGTMPTA